MSELRGAYLLGSHSTTWLRGTLGFAGLDVAIQYCGDRALGNDPTRDVVELYASPVATQAGAGSVLDHFQNARERGESAALARTDVVAAG